MVDLQTVEMLCAAKVVAEDEIDAAVEAFLGGRPAGPFAFRSGHRVDLVRAVRNHPGARDFVARAEVGIALKRPFVRAAILQARPIRR